MCSWTIKGLLLLVAGVPFLGAASIPCATGTLASYISSPSCTVGPNLTFEDFGFQRISSTGITLPINASQITVKPDASGAGLDFSSNSLFQLNAGQSINLVVTYEIVAAGLSQVGSSLVSPVVGPSGSIGLDESLCLGSVFDQGVCAGSTASLNLFDGGGTQTLSGLVSFPAQNMLGISDSLQIEESSLQAMMNSPVNVTSLPPVPEPSSILLCAVALLTLGWYFRLFRRC